MNPLMRGLVRPTTARPTPLGSTEPILHALGIGRRMRATTLRTDGRPLPRRTSLSDLVEGR